MELLGLVLRSVCLSVTVRGPSECKGVKINMNANKSRYIKIGSTSNTRVDVTVLCLVGRVSRGTTGTSVEGWGEGY